MQKQRLAAGSATAVVRNGVAIATVDAPKARNIHKDDEVNISAYFRADGNASLPMVKTKTKNNVNNCPGEAFLDPVREYNVPVCFELGESR